MLVNIVRYAKGWVEFKATGKFPERMLNITSRFGINLWDAHPCDGGLNASMSISDYRKIRLIARKAKVKTRITQKHGLPFFAEKYKPRIGIPIGAAAGLMLLLILSNFVWSISVQGTKNVSDTKLLEILAESGVETGAYKDKLDVQKIERNALLKVDEIGWMSINITGSLVSVEVKEKAQKPQIDEILNPCNIKAKSDGVITKINAKNGETVVKIGSGVTKGDLLVSGTTQTKLETTRYVHAKAEVFADVNSAKELSIAKKYNYFSLTENKTDRRRLQFLWWDFPFSVSFNSYENSAYTHSSKNLCVNNVVLPLGIKTETDLEALKTEFVLNDEIAEKAFVNRLLLYEVFEKSESSVVGRNINISSDNENYYCTCDYVFNENIAETVDFSVTE